MIDHLPEAPSCSVVLCPEIGQYHRTVWGIGNFTLEIIKLEGSWWKEIQRIHLLLGEMRSIILFLLFFLLFLLLLGLFFFLRFLFLLWLLLLFTFTFLLWFFGFLLLLLLLLFLLLFLLFFHLNRFGFLMEMDFVLLLTKPSLSEH